MNKRRVGERRKTRRKAEEFDVLSPAIRPRFQAACRIVVQKYCDAFQFWRDCRYKACRAARRCAGDQSYCLEMRLRSVPGEVRHAAASRMLDETPPHADRLLRLAHRYPLDSLCVHIPSPRTLAKTQAAMTAGIKNDVGS